MANLYGFGTLADPIPEPELPLIPPDWPHRPETIARHLEGFRAMLETPLPQPVAVGDGLVYVGGGPYWPGIVIGLRMLRETGSTLPVQIWHRGAAEPVNPDQVKGLGPVEIIDATEHAARHGGARILRGWEAKLWALAHCGFRRVLFLDADAYLVDKPEPLLDQLDRADFVFWSDLPGNYGTLKWDQVWPTGNRQVPAVQGGQIALDRARAWRLLILCHWMCQHSDFYFSHMFGDQDTWRAGLGALPDIRWTNLGAAPWVRTAFVCPTPDRVPRVVHRCQGKLFRIWEVPSGKENYNSPQYALPKEEAVFRHLADLLAQEEKSPEETFGEIYRRRLWGGTSGPGSLSAEAAPFINLVNTLVDWAGITSVVDLGSGDGEVGQRIKVRDYTGVDCHLPHIVRLQHEHPERTWIHGDLFNRREQLPPGQLAIMKDVLHHWPTRMVVDWLEWARRSGKWGRILLVYDRGQVGPEADCHLGGYRALTHTMAPLDRFGLVPVVEYLHKEVTILDLRNRATPGVN